MQLLSPATTTTLQALGEADQAHLSEEPRQVARRGADAWDQSERGARNVASAEVPTCVRTENAFERMVSTATSILLRRRHLRHCCTGISVPGFANAEQAERRRRLLARLRQIQVHIMNLI